MNVELAKPQASLVNTALNQGYTVTEVVMVSKGGSTIHIDPAGHLKDGPESEGDKVRKLRAENSRLAADLSKEKGKIDRAADSVKQAEKVVAQLMHEVPSVHRELLEKLLVNFDAAQQDE